MSLNLSALRTRLVTLLDHDPELQRYKNELDDLLNDAYLGLWNERRWTFAERTVDLATRPDLSYARQNLTVSVADMSREVTFSAACYPLDPHPEWFTGQVIELGSEEYEIIKVPDTSTLRLATPYRGAALTGDTSWRLKHRWVWLPEDCIEVLELSDRDAPRVSKSRPGTIPLLDATRETWLNTSIDATGNRVEHASYGSPVSVPPGETCTASTDTHGDATLTDGATYELCWCFEAPGGGLGPLSESVVVTTGSGGSNNNRITVTSTTHAGNDIAASVFAAAIDTHRNAWEGYRKVWWFNANYKNGARLGRPKWRLVTYATGAINTQLDHQPAYVDDETAALTIHRAPQLSDGNPEYVAPDGHRSRIRLYPRLDNWDSFVAYAASSPVSYAEYRRSLRLRYRHRPPRLTASTDTPQVPGHLHALIYLRAMIDLCYKHGLDGRAASYERRQKPLRKQLEESYLDHIDVAYRRAFWTGEGAPPPYYDLSTLEKLP